MTHTVNTRRFSGLGARLLSPSHWIAFALIACLISLAAPAARAQNSVSSNTWKSIAIIGGSSAAGAYIGHKVAGRNGTWIGAAGGAAVGYAIDRHRRNNQYYNQAYGYNGNYDPNAGYYPNDGGYNGNSGYNGNGGYYGNSGYQGGPYNGAPYYGSGFRSSSYQSNSSNTYQRGQRCRR